MAIGKNRKTYKKKGSKKKAVDPFTRKEWYGVRVPALFEKRDVGRTPINKTAGKRIASEDIKGRIFEISLGDLNEDSEEKAFRKMRFIVEDVRGKDVLLNFHGMDFTRDKLASLLRKWQSLIEANVDIKTADGYTIRMFCIAFTARRPNQQRKTSYAQSSQIRAIRKKMIEVMNAEASTTDMKGIMGKIVAGTIGTEIEKASRSVYPLYNTFIRKIKVIKAPKPDVARLMDVHGEGGEDAGRPITRVEDGAVATLEGAGGRL